MTAAAALSTTMLPRSAGRLGDVIGVTSRSCFSITLICSRTSQKIPLIFVCWIASQSSVGIDENFVFVPIVCTKAISLGFSNPQKLTYPADVRTIVDSPEMVHGGLHEVLNGLLDADISGDDEDVKSGFSATALHSSAVA